MAVDGFTLASQISTVRGFASFTRMFVRRAYMFIFADGCLSVKFPLVTESLFDRGRS